MRAPWENASVSDAYKELTGQRGKSFLPTFPPDKRLDRLTGRLGEHFEVGGAAHKTGVRLYFLGVFEPSGKASFQLLPHVQAIDVQKSFATFFEWTLGSVPLRQTMGRREEIITLQGKGAAIGLGHPLFEAQGSFGEGDVGKERAGKQRKKNSLEQFEALHRFLNEYDNRGTTANNTMVLYMPFEGHAYYIEPTEFSYNSSVGSSKFGFDWTFVCKAWSYTAPDVDLVFDKKKAKLSALETVQNAIAQVNALAKDVEGLVGSYLDYVNRWVATIVGATDVVGNFLGIYTEGVAPKATLSRAISAANLATSRLLKDLDDLADATPFVEKNNVLSSFAREARVVATESFDAGNSAVLASQSLPFSIDSSALERLDSELESPAGYFHPPEVVSSTTTSEGNEPGLVDPITSPFKDFLPEENLNVSEYVVRSGDTFESISLLTLGDPSSWTLIAALNGSTDAHGLAGDKPLTVGEKILVPGDPLALTFGADVISDRFFTDFKIGNDGDFVLSGTGTTDVKLVSDKLCVQQDLKHALTTVKGQSLIFPDLGLTHEVGTAGTVSNISQIVFDIQSTMLRDPRVKSVTDVELIDDGAELVINSTATVFDSKTINVTVPV